MKTNTCAIFILGLLLLSLFILSVVRAEDSYSLLILPSIGGTTDLAPTTYFFASESMVTLHAYPNVGYIFAYWKLDGTVITNSSVNVYMTANHELQAQFTPIFCLLAIPVATGGSASLPSGVHPYPFGTIVTITASPDIGNIFENWILDGGNFVGTTIIINMTADHVAHPVFAPINFTLTIAKATGGTINSYSDGTYLFTYGRQMSFIATPNSGYTFTHWLLDQTRITDNPFSVVMNQSYTLQAVFQSVTTPTATPTPTPSPTPTSTPIQTPNPTSTPIVTPSPIQTPVPTLSPTTSPTPIAPTPLATATLSPTPKSTPIQSAVPSPTRQSSPSASPTLTVSSLTSDAPTPELTVQNASGMNLGIPVVAAVSVIGAVLAGLFVRKKRKPSFIVLS